MNKPRILTMVILLFSLTIFAMGLSSTLSQPLLNDEAEFSAAAEAIEKTGTPIYYVGSLPKELRGDGDRWIFGATPLVEHQFGAWHTNLLLYLIAGTYRILGVSAASTRLVCLIFLAFSFFLSLKILQKVTEEEQTPHLNSSKFLIFSVLFATSPFLLQNGLMIDFDNSILTTVCLWFIYEYIKCFDRSDWGARLKLSGILLLSFWAKEYGPLFLITPAVLLHLFRKSWRGLLELAVLSTLSGFGAILTWHLYCEISGVPFDYFIQFSYLRRMDAGEAFTWHRHLLNLIFSLRLSFVWNAGVLFILLIGTPVYYFKKTINQNKPVLAYLVYFVGVYYFIAKVARPSLVSMKYEYPAYPVLFILLSSALGTYFSLLNGRSFRAVLFSIAAVALAINFVIPDPILPIVSSPLEHTGVILLFSVQMVLGLIIYLGLSSLSKGRKSGLILSIFCVGVGTSISISLAQRHNYQTAANWTSDYGTRGFEDLISFLKSTDICHSTSVIRKDIGARLRSDLTCPEMTWLDPSILRLLTNSKTNEQSAKTLPFSAKYIVYEVEPAYSHYAKAILSKYGYTLTRYFHKFHVFSFEEKQ